MPNRIIKNGKLDVCIELIGGASDGMLCNTDLDIIRIPKRINSESLLLSDEFVVEMPNLRYDEYVRISKEKAVLRGLPLDVNGF